MPGTKPGRKRADRRCGRRSRAWLLMVVREATRRGGFVADQRTTLLRSMLPIGGRGLEIGPGFNPLLPKAEGFQIETADYMDADGLRKKYRDNPHVNVTRIEMVDHVLDQGRTFAEVVGRPQTF